MMMFDHPFLMKLFATYRDKHRLFFLSEVCLGGELFSLLRERTLFDEDTAKFYAASVLVAFEYMHSLNIIYRDLKPENLLLDKDGFLKVTDFGFAKDITSGRTWTLCGTPDYLGQSFSQFQTPVSSATPGHWNSFHSLRLLLLPRLLCCSAPEIVAGKGHGKGVDWWTLGQNPCTAQRTLDQNAAHWQRILRRRRSLISLRS
jgi:serine/threonine protein kinase